MTTYTITFINGGTLSSLQTTAWSYWDACAWAWDNCPAGTDEFDVTPKE